MKQVIFNVGFSCLDKGSSIFTYFPISWQVGFETFSKIQRTKENIEELFLLAEKYYTPPHCVILCIRVEEDDLCWEYVIKMINVREYREHWEVKFNRKWKEN